jgi:protoporphyrinogen oxidase
MVPDVNKTCLGMEYFVFENDELWSSPDDKLLEMARREIAELGLVRPEEIEDGTVVRMQKAYPMYDEDWSAQVDTIRAYLSENMRNLQLVGRNGMHKYNNQDHAMMTALLAARNVLAGEKKYDVWAVNEDGEYLEAGAAGEQSNSGWKNIAATSANS